MSTCNGECNCSACGSNRGWGAYSSAPKERQPPTPLEALAGADTEQQGSFIRSAIERVLDGEPVLKHFLLDPKAPTDYRALRPVYGNNELILEEVQLARQERLQLQMSMSSRQLQEMLFAQTMNPGEVLFMLLRPMILQFIENLLYSFIRDNVEMVLPVPIPGRAEKTGFYLAGSDAYGALYDSLHYERGSANVIKLAQMPKELVLWLPELPYNASRLLQELEFIVVRQAEIDFAARYNVILSCKAPVRTYIVGAVLYRAARKPEPSSTNL